ncbi:MAG: hypothetical protein M3401_14035 [Actinomycetota bacterium]|nr:hypothetical protein [Actinomycetota bacterium]
MPDGQLLAGHTATWGELLERLKERRGLTVLVADPLSGTSALLAAALEHSGQRYVAVDARRCADTLDLAMAIADAAIGALAPEANAWWLGAAPPASTAGLRVWRALSDRGVNPDELREGEADGATRLDQALDIIAIFAPEAAVLAIDHLGSTLSNIRAGPAREILAALRAARQRHNNLDLILVDQPQGPISDALSDADHPLYRAGERLRVRRPSPSRMIDDLVIVKPLVRKPIGLLRVAAELTAGVPALTWQVVALASADGDDAARAVAGWSALRRANAVSVRQEWDLLRRVHPAAQTLVAAISLDLKPHSVPAASKTVDDGLNRLRDVGLAWQPAERTWAIADPLLAAFAREHAPPWALRRRAAPRIRASPTAGDSSTA